MPMKKCDACGKMLDIPMDQWRLVSYEGDYVCCLDCILEWLKDQTEWGSCELALPDGVVANPEVPIEFKSDFERQFSEWLDMCGISWVYERFTFPVGEKSTYTPDFFLPEFGSFIETKGRWQVGQKKKMLLFRKTYPDISILVVPWTTASLSPHPMETFEDCAGA